MNLFSRNKMQMCFLFISTLVMVGCPDSGDNHSNDVVAGAFYFYGDNGIHGRELWNSDGTSSGTSMIKDINPGSNSSNNFLDAIRVGANLLFRADDGTRGMELWKTNGTEEGTDIVKDINLTFGSLPISLRGVAVNETLYFRADDGIHGWELWKSDGFPEGTTLVKDIFPGNSSGPQPWHLSSFSKIGSSSIIFTAGDDIHGPEPWISDGSENGTVILKDIHPFAGSHPDEYFMHFNESYFWASDGSNSNNYELWRSNGSEAGTLKVKNILPSTLGITNPGHYFGTLGNFVYISAYDPVAGGELWKTDGTSAGTIQVKDINPGLQSSEPRILKAANGVLYFFADDGTNGFELWKTDGTDAGTVLVKDIFLGMESSVLCCYTESFVINSKIYFTASDGIHGFELWKSDGTNAGTVLIKDINPGPGVGFGPAHFFSYNGVLYFSANDGVNGRELWRSDGSADGTFMVKDICAGSCSGYPYP